MAEINYQLLNDEATNELQVQFQHKLAQRGTGNARGDSLRYIVLTSVISDNYNMAKKDLVHYVDSKKDFPALQERASRYVTHCKDLIAAIKSKRNFPGLSTLPNAKQQEMLEKVLDHYDELAHYLKRIEAINAEVMINDLRSTVFVLRTASYCVALVLFIVFIMELILSIYGSYDMLMTDVAKDFTNWIFDLGY